MIKIKIINIFKTSFDLRNFEFEIEKSRLSFDASFMIRFKLTNVDKACEIYRKINHVIHDYEIITNLKPFKKIRFFLLKNKPFIS